jgi:hypothetical protein
MASTSIINLTNIIKDQILGNENHCDCTNKYICQNIDHWNYNNNNIDIDMDIHWIYNEITTIEYIIRKHNINSLYNYLIYEDIEPVETISVLTHKFINANEKYILFLIDLFTSGISSDSTHDKIYERINNLLQTNVYF